MRISAQAMDPDSVNTISILIQVGGKQVVALVDSGSNSTFINLQFALKTSCTILMDKSRSVAVAGGGKLWSRAYIPDTYFTASKHKFMQTFRNLEIPGVGIKTGGSRVGGPKLWILDRWGTRDKGHDVYPGLGPL
jgi:hypothetical protein